MGVGEQANLVHLIDFGLSKEFRDPKTHVHIPYKKELGLAGTAVFASINSHLGLELGRRDDLESLAYILFYFLWGFLPWQGLGNEDMLESKRTISEFNFFHELPTEFRTFFEHCRSLSFDGKPHYDHFLALFDNLLSKEVFHSDTAFDWDVAGGKFTKRGRRKGGIIKHEQSPSVRRRTGQVLTYSFINLSPCPDDDVYAGYARRGLKFTFSRCTYSRPGSNASPPLSLDVSSFLWIEISVFLAQLLPFRSTTRVHGTTVHNASCQSRSFLSRCLLSSPPLLLDDFQPRSRYLSYNKKARPRDRRRL